MSVKVIEGMPLFQAFDKEEFYHILKSGSVEDIDNQVALLSGGTIIEKNAYIGTLLMKKANLVPVAKDKISLFKAGRIKLETEIASDSSNVEYRFLRLIIAENAPKITKYQSQIVEDGRYIRQYFRKLSTVVQHVVLDYSKTSKILRPEDFKLQ
jgi:hypothetical protein